MYNLNKNVSLILLTLAILTLFTNIPQVHSGEKIKGEVIEIKDQKEWKRLIKLKTNVLILFSNGKSPTELWRNLYEVSEIMRGQGTIGSVDCSQSDGKKLCKKVKAAVDKKGSYIFKHYHNGDFNKNYDRAEKVSSFVNFLKDPTGDIPWEEDKEAEPIFHLPDLPTLLKMVKKEKRGVMIMFYAPWCGYCKKLKPDYIKVAEEIGDEAVVAALDVNRPENAAARKKFNITGFPTLLYFRNGKMQQYEGDNNKDGLLHFLRNPDAPPPEKPKEEEWADEPSDVVHLTTETFDNFLKENPSVLIMFYANWCGHCKRMKPHYTSAASRMIKEGIKGKLAAVDSVKESSIGSKFDVKGFPTIKYFKDGEFAFDGSSLREEDPIVQFMKDPKEIKPPPPEKAWSDEESAVAHLTEATFKTALKKKKRALVMFYAPWCGHCKSTKPAFTEAAEELKDDPKVLLGAVDCTQHQPLCSTYEVQGFPTFKLFTYFNKEAVQPYEGGRQKADFVSEMKGGSSGSSGESSAEKEEKNDWEGIAGQELVLKLNENDFEPFIKSAESVLVMFYSPRCTHCVAMKPDYAQAAKKLSEKSPASVLAAVDCQKNRKMNDLYKIRGYPTLRYFRNGVDIGEFDKGRKEDDFVSFMLNPPNSRDEL